MNTCDAKVNARPGPVPKPVPEDLITVLYPVDPETNEDVALHPGKTFPGPGLKGIQYNAGRWFRGVQHRVRTAQELAAVVDAVASDGRGFIVLGQMRSPGAARFARRKNANADGVFPGLKSARHRALPLDLDKIPNLQRLDPRTAPVETVRYLLSLLPPAFDDVVMGYDWSSSTCRGCDGAPEVLGAHLWPMLDTALTEDGMRDLLKRLSAFVRRRLTTAGHTITNKKWKPVDPKLADAQQPIYVVPPVFTGEADPFPGESRRGLLDGARPTVCLADMLLELAADEALVPQAPARTNSARSTVGRRPASRERVKVIPLQIAKGAIEAAHRAMAAKDDATLYPATCYDVFVSRAVAEAVDLMRDRVARGETDREWSAWWLAGGIPEGLRYTYCTPIAAMVIAGLPDDMLSKQAARAAVASILRLIVSEEWLDVEWFGQNMDAELIARVERDAKGDSVPWRGMLKPCRFGYGKDRIIEELEIDHDEMVRLELVSLADNRGRCAIRAEKKGRRTLDEVKAERPVHVHSAEIARLTAEGWSIAAIAEKLGVSEGTVKRARRAAAGKTPVARSAAPKTAVKAAVTPSPVRRAATMLSITEAVAMLEDAHETPAPVAATPTTDAAVAKTLYLAQRYAGVYGPADIASETGLDEVFVVGILRANGLLDAIALAA